MMSDAIKRAYHNSLRTCYVLAHVLAHAMVETHI
jgi:hypothetical protein